MFRNKIHHFTTTTTTNYYYYLTMLLVTEATEITQFSAAVMLLDLYSKGALFDNVN
jgi:hypothetical protein